MALELLESLSLPGDAAKANEDAFGHDAAAAVVMDGTTPLGDSIMPGKSDAAWVAQFGARRLLAHLRDGDGARKALRGALADAEKSFHALRLREPEDVWQTPCASMMMAFCAPSALRIASAATGTSPAIGADAQRGRATEIEFLWLGDCAALLKQGDAPVTVIGDALDAKAAESKTARQAASDNSLAATELRHHIPLLRERRNRVNSGDYWLFSPDTRPAAHVRRRIVKAAPGAILLLASDGFLALASDYGAYSPDTLMQAAMERGLDVLGEELRAIEHADAQGAKFPRFKMSDDATALLLKVQ